MPAQNKAYVYRGGQWVLIGATGNGAAIVSIPTPLPPDFTGAFWIHPTEIAGGYPVTDVLAAIKGQTIAPKAIDIDGPNTIFFGTNADGTPKLFFKVDSPSENRATTEEVFATEEWVLGVLGNRPPVTGDFSNARPPVYLDAPVTEQPNGLPIGLTADGMEIHQPYMIGAVPVMVGGRRYLMPLLEAPATASGADPTPLFTYADAPVTQQLDGTIIGLNAAGTELTQPYMVGGVSVLVGGKRYLLPIIEE